jgi:GTP-binding protein
VASLRYGAPCFLPYFLPLCFPWPFVSPGPPMRFIDEVSVHVISGTGGDGISTFRREKYVAFGGPDGGDGGKGGDVIFFASRGRSTLLELRAHAVWRAEDGGRGGSRNKTGANGADALVAVPLGTRIYDEGSGELVGDLVNEGDRLKVARGGDGGFGNTHFKTSTNRAPRKKTPGWPGTERRLRLELMLMADVGLLGFPNAGKSTLISRLSAARPKVADYPFTTLVPSLGVVEVGHEGSFVIADIPGLIEGAAHGAGLGHRFLRHLGRTRLLLHLISASPDETLSAARRYEIIREELAKFDPHLSERPELLVLTKTDTLPPEALVLVEKEIRRAAKGKKLLKISAVSGQGVAELKALLYRLVQELPAPELPVPRPEVLLAPTLPAADAPELASWSGVTRDGVEWEYAPSASDEDEGGEYFDEGEAEEEDEDALAAEADASEAEDDGEELGEAAGEDQDEADADAAGSADAGLPLKQTSPGPSLQFEESDEGWIEDWEGEETPGGGG